jgi:CRISPR-associated endonuclease/helicase Cas3
VIPPQFDGFFQAATKKLSPKLSPYDYQRRLACGERNDRPKAEWLASGTECNSRLINIPTGLGKTAAVVLAWLWNRVQFPNSKWPRRLVYCLPMRTLVEQTRDEVDKWLKNLLTNTADLGISGQALKNLQLLAEHSPIVLMGGEELDDSKRDWDIHPERPAILIGTQDMILSRALNRGYGMSRARWPMHFGLLNNDCLWIFDEVQLMGNGLATGIQLDAFRAALWLAAMPCPTWWMSATSSSDVFSTTDRAELAVPPPEVFEFIEEHESESLKSRLRAEKAIELLAKPPKPADVLKQHQEHQAGRLTLIVVNTVGSALQWHADIKEQLEKLRGNKHKPSKPIPDVILLHSRFRRVERDERMSRLQEFLKLTCDTGVAPENHPGLIVVSTQVVEAGMDLSSAALWSEVAPWPSVIQRLGRLNRDSKQSKAVGKFWMPKPKDEENGKDSPNVGRNGPYEKIALKNAEDLIKTVVNRQRKGEEYRAALDAVLAGESSKQALKLTIPVVIRADDVHGLFPTEPDLAGGFTNIAPFVRTADLSSDVTIYWRDFKGTPPEDTDEAATSETVQVPSHLLGHFLAGTKKTAFLWDDDSERWDSIPAREVVPGMILLLPKSAGGYSCERGWTGDPEDKPTVLTLTRQRRSSLFTDNESKTGWQSLSEHTAAVAAATSTLATRLNFPDAWQQAFAAAAKWHDTGKAHHRWQEMLPPAPVGRTGPWGKFSGSFVTPPRVRHEAFSLLAAWRQRLADTSELTALALYLIASHHGKIRTVLRNVRRGDNLFGWQANDDPLLIEGHPSCVMDLSVRHFAGNGQVNWASKSFKPGRPSWIALVEELLGPAWRGDVTPQIAIPANEPRALGPFQLAYLEAVFRAADARASRGDFLPAHP